MIGFDYTDVEAARAAGVAYLDCDALYSGARRLDADDADDDVDAQLAVVWPPGMPSGESADERAASVARGRATSFGKLAAGNVGATRGRTSC